MFKYIALFVFVGLVAAQDDSGVKWLVCRQGTKDVECVDLYKQMLQEIANLFDHKYKAQNLQTHREKRGVIADGVRDRLFESLYYRLNTLQRMKQAIIKNGSKRVFDYFYGNLNRINESIRKIKERIERYTNIGSNNENSSILPSLPSLPSLSSLTSLPSIVSTLANSAL